MFVFTYTSVNPSPRALHSTPASVLLLLIHFYHHYYYYYCYYSCAVFTKVRYQYCLCIYGLLALRS